MALVSQIKDLDKCSKEQGCDGPVTEAIAKIEKHLNQVAHGGFLFYDDKGMPLVAMHWEHRFNHMVDRYNDIYIVQMPNITPHVCRHTYCSNQAKAGMNPKTLQYLMGHSDISVTLNTYTHLNLEDAQKELNRIEDLEAVRRDMEKQEKRKLLRRCLRRGEG